ncbi:MAG: TetR/AcrR family transcriptional regulator [Oscillospiraceae bacterium]|nr:TetR/AcrR family transcriptional regulator [Oscillospiraceae bacterium]
MRDKAKDTAQMAQKRRRILEEGFRLFSQRGIETVTMPEIAEAAGVGRSSLYRYFSAKSDLVVAVGTWKWEEYIRAQQAANPAEGLAPLTAAEHLDRYLELFLDLYRNQRDILRFNQFFNIYIRSEQPSREQMRPYLEMIAKIMANFHNLYDKAKKDGTVRTDISEAAMVSSVFHIMLAAVTRYAVGLVYLDKGAGEPEGELLLLKSALLRELTAVPTLPKML